VSENLIGNATVLGVYAKGLIRCGDVESLLITQAGLETSCLQTAHTGATLKSGFKMEIPV
jgi:hypothetical protein